MASKPYKGVLPHIILIFISVRLKNELLVFLKNVKHPSMLNIL